MEGIIVGEGRNNLSYFNDFFLTGKEGSLSILKGIGGGFVDVAKGKREGRRRGGKEGM